MSENKKGYEVTAEQKIAEKIQAAILGDVKLKQWCIEKAIQSNATPSSVIAMGEQIFEFLTEKQPSPASLAEPPILDYRN